MTKFTKALTGRPFAIAKSLDSELAARDAHDVFLQLSQPSAGLEKALAPVVLAAAGTSEAAAPEDTLDSLGDPVAVLPCITDPKTLLVMALDSVNGAGFERLPVSGTTDDEPAGLGIAVGGSAVGLIDSTGDQDTYTVDLVAGQRYLISLRGTGATALHDTYLELFDPTNANILNDDDGGNGLFSLMTVTASATGTYTIRASSFANPGDPGVGEYTLDVLQMTGIDTVPNTLAGAVTLSEGNTFGFRETAGTGATNTFTGGDADLYKVHLEAGKNYQFSVAGGHDYASGTTNNVPVGEINTLLTIFNSSGVQITGAQNNDIATNDKSSSLTFYAAATGDYYVQITGAGDGGVAGRNTGGYAIDFHAIDVTGQNPLDAIHWNNAANIPTVMVNGVPTAYVYFAVSGENFGENARVGDPNVPAAGGNGTLPSFGWNDTEKAAFMNALAEYSKLTGITYLVTGDSSQATFRAITTNANAYGAYAYPQDPAYGTQKGILAFNVNSGGWDKPGFSTQDIPGDQVGLQKGGFNFGVILHELGHAHGMSHPHDTGGGSVVMPGVVAAEGSYGVFRLNQGVYTVMSYNEGWDFHPDGKSPLFTTTTGSGWSTFGAFDIAELQARYGVHDNNTGDNVYTLTDVIANSYYETIWDTGGTDTIAYGGALSAQIDLTAATIDYSPIGGGAISFLDNGAATTNLRGGFTIANNVVIENATGGSGNDTLIGNAAANVLTGNGGNDNFVGRGGDDTIVGGAGNDTAYYDGVSSDYSVTRAFDANGNVVTTVTDLNTSGPADSTNPVMVANEGTDTLSGVEALHFSDATVNIAGNILVYDANDQLVGSFSTIQAAVNASDDGYTIEVGTGVYVEQVTISDIDNLTIEAAPNADVTIQAPVTLAANGTHSATAGGTSVYGIVTAIDSTGLTINGVNIDGAGHGDSVPTSGADFAGVFFRNSSGELVGVDITGVRSSYLDANLTADGYPDLRPFQAGTGIAVDNDTLLSFTMTGGSIADFQKNAGRFWNGDLDISDVTVTGGGAQTTGPAQNGFVIESGTGSIHDNTITAIGYAGPVLSYSVMIYARGVDNLDVTSNVLTGTNGATLDAKVLGIAYYDINDANNGGHVTNNAIAFVDTGIDVEGELGGPPIVISGNTVANVDFSDAFSPSGVYFQPGASLVPLAFNVEGTGVHDTLYGGSSSDTLSGLGGDDLFTGLGGNDTLNGGAGVDEADYSGNIADYAIVYDYDAEGNIVGFLSVTDNNLANGDEGHDTLSSVEAIGFADVVLNASQSVHLFDGTTLIGTFDTIQDAIDAASDGNTISAMAGTYNEDLTVNKDVTIIGANDGVAGDGTRGAETIIDGQIVIVSNGVTIDGVSVVGDGSGAVGTTAIVVNPNVANFSLVNSVLDGTGDVAIEVGSGASGLDVGNNLLHGYSIGMYIAGGTTAGTVHDNQFQGDNAGYGVGMGSGVTSETSHVVINGNTFDGIYAGSLNLIPFGPDPVDINTYVFDNIISDSGVERPIQIHPTLDSTHIIGTDENEAFYDVNQGLPGELAVSLGFDGRGGDDVAYGNSLSDDLRGGDGSDQLFGFGGDDTLSGGAGNDLIDGEAGIDTAVFADNALIYSDTVIGWLVSSSEGNDFLQRTEIVVDGAGERNLLVGGTAFAGIQAALDTAVADDNVRLAAGNYSGTFNYDVAGLTVIAQNGAVQNVTYATAGTDGITVVAAGGADTITTGAGNDIVFGGAGVDHLNGGAGNDALVGGTGADVMAGGTGNDTFYVDVAGDAIVEVAGEGNDRVAAAASYTLAAGVSVETVEAINLGDTTAINLFGNEFDQTIVGNAGANALGGGGGADVLIGAGGNDTYYVDAFDTVLESVGGGNDRIAASASFTLNAGAEVETIEAINSTDTTAINLFGNEFAQRIIGNAGNNALGGGGGGDALIGLGGNDTYYVSAGDTIEEYAGGGADRVAATGSFTLNAGASVELIEAINRSGTEALNLTGNEFAQQVAGNDGNNVINGGLGNDLLTGYAGADTFAFTTALGANNVDTIEDFVHGTDKIALDDAVFTAIGGLGSLNANAFVTGTAAGDADDRIIYNSATGELFYDADGNGAGAAVLFAQLHGAPTLTASDFQVI